VSWQPPTDEQAVEGPPPAVQRAKPTISKTNIIGSTIAGLVVIVVAFFVIRAVNDDNDDGGQEQRPAAATQPAPDPTPALIDLPIGEQLEAMCGTRLRACGVEFQEIGDAQTFVLLPSGLRGSRGPELLGAWIADTGCLEDVDLARIEQTRALDGMVESANGKSTWTYHPDDGLTIVCDTS